MTFYISSSEMSRDRSRTWYNGFDMRRRGYGKRHTGVSGSRASGRPSSAQSKVSDLDLDVVQVDHHDPLRDHESPLPAPGHLTRNMR